MVDTQSDENVVQFPREISDSSTLPWQRKIAEAQRLLDRSAAELDTHIEQRSRVDAGDTLTAKRALMTVSDGMTRLAAWVAVASVALILFAVLSQPVAAVLVSGGVVFALGAAMHQAWFSSHQDLRSTQDSFVTLRDADVEDRRDLMVYRFYREIYADVFRLWEAGGVQNPADLQTTGDLTLTTILNTEARRVSHASCGPVTLVVVESTQEEFVARRSSLTGPGHQLAPGLRYPADTTLDAVLDRYASFHATAEFYVSGRVYYLGALSDERFTGAAMALVEGAAANYQAGLQILALLMERAEYSSVSSSSTVDA